MILSIIAAYAKDRNGRRVIGKDNQLPWHFSHDLERFKEYTLDSAIIMGRNTFESIGRVLPRRDNVILTASKKYEVPGAHVFHDLESALDFASLKHSEVFIIGGQTLYEQTIDRVDRLYLTSFRLSNVEGDAFFPSYNASKFRLIHIEKTEVYGDCFRILERRREHDQPSNNEESRTTEVYQVDNPYNLEYIWGGHGF